MPPSLPIDWVALTAVVMGTLMFLIPIAGLTLRFVLKPAVDALKELSSQRTSQEQVDMLERRMALVEQHIESIDTQVTRLVEAREFHKQLETPTE